MQTAAEIAQAKSHYYFLFLLLLSHNLYNSVLQSVSSLFKSGTYRHGTAHG